MYITLRDIQPYLNKGWTNVKIAYELNLHPTTVGKLRKGIIKKSRQIGEKGVDSPIADINPIWKYLDIDYPFILMKAKYIAYNYSLQIQDVVDRLLNLLYTNKGLYRYLKKEKIRDSKSFLSYWISKNLYSNSQNWLYHKKGVTPIHFFHNI